MRKKRVKEMLYEIRKNIIKEIDEPTEELDEFIFKNEVSSTLYGYQVGMSRAAMILLDKIRELYPEEE